MVYLNNSWPGMKRRRNLCSCTFFIIACWLIPKCSSATTTKQPGGTKTPTETSTPSNDSSTHLDITTTTEPQGAMTVEFSTASVPDSTNSSGSEYTEPVSTTESPPTTSGSDSTVAGSSTLTVVSATAQASTVSSDNGTGAALNTFMHLCGNKDCQHGGQCYIEVDVNNETVARCRCQETSGKIYKGDNCEASKLGRGRERAITLGILLPFDVLFLIIIIAMCVKLKNGGNRLHAVQKSYDINKL